MWNIYVSIFSVWQTIMVFCWFHWKKEQFPDKKRHLYGIFHAKVSADAGAWRNEFRGDHACTLRVYLGTTLEPLGRVDSSIYIDLSMEVFSRSNILTRHDWSVPNHYAAVPRSWVWWVASEAQWGDREVVVDSQVWFRNPTSISWSSIYIENLPIFTGFSDVSTRAGSSLWVINTGLSWTESQ